MQVVPHGGVGEIGGNCFEVRAGRTRLLLDAGISFQRYGQAFSEFLKPRKVNGIGDWRLAGVAPDIQGLYRDDFMRQAGLKPEPAGAGTDGVHAVLLSHPHLDHIGLLPLLHPDVQVGSSPTAFAVAKAIEETGGSFDQSDFTTYFEEYRFYENKKGGRSKAKSNTEGHEPAERPWNRADRMDLDGVTAHLLPVDHSIHGARGILLEGEVQLAYSGDLRMHGRNRQFTQRFVERCGGVDLLLIEGTNVHNEKHAAKPGQPGGHLADFKALQDYTEAAVESYLAERLGKDSGFVFVAYPQRDLDRLETFLRVARKLKRKLCLTTKQAYLLDTIRATAATSLDTPVPTTDDPDLRIYVPRRGWGLVDRPAMWDDARHLIEAEYQAWERPYLSHPNTVFRADVAQDPGKHLLFADLWNLTELHEFAAPDGSGLSKPGGVYVNSKTEPFSEEMEQDRRRLAWWLHRWGLREEGAHVSGHARLEELVWMADQMGARRVVPVHTEHAAHFAQAIGPRAVVPGLGKPIPLAAATKA